jgi:hypothetical protein
MIQIDDAGSGSLIGGTCIGAVRVETKEYLYDFIPLKYYREDNFKNKRYLMKCKDIVMKLLNALNAPINEEIHICRGYMFDEARKFLMQVGYSVYATKIEDPLQNMIEMTFQDYANGLGLPLQYTVYTKYPFHFHRILRWVYADYTKRSKLCKTGWKSWKKYGNVEVKSYYDHLYKENYTCLRCGKKIHRGSRVRVLKYYSNCPNTVYLHDSC